MSIRERTFYNKKAESDWMSHVSWIADADYDVDFEALGDEMLRALPAL